MQVCVIVSPRGFTQKIVVILITSGFSCDFLIGFRSSAWAAARFPYFQIGRYWLASTSQTSSRTGHYLQEMEIGGSCLYQVHGLLGIVNRALRQTSLYSFSFQSSNVFSILTLLILTPSIPLMGVTAMRRESPACHNFVCRPECSLHNTTCDAKYYCSSG